MRPGTVGHGAGLPDRFPLVKRQRKPSLQIHLEKRTLAVALGLGLGLREFSGDGRAVIRVLAGLDQLPREAVGRFGEADGLFLDGHETLFQWSLTDYRLRNAPASRQGGQLRAR